MASQSIQSGASANLNSNAVSAPSGEKFAGWTTSIVNCGKGYGDRDIFEMGSADVILYAVWVPTSMVTYIASNSIYISDYTTTQSGTFSIPCGINRICCQGFMDCNNINKIIIPASVDYISFRMAWYCPALTLYAVDPANIYYYSDANGVIYNKAKTEMVIMPDGFSGSYSILAGTTSIEDQACCGCSGLVDITIPSTVTTIGEDAFCDCGFTSISIPNGVITISTIAFSECGSLTSVSIPSSVISIGDGAFSNCKKLATITVASGNQYYMADASSVLYNKTQTKLIQAPGKISGTYSMPNTVVSIGDDAFYACSALIAISFSADITSIGAAAFCGTGLTSITIPSKVASIFAYTFEACPSLVSVTIPSNITNIGSMSFIGCTNLTTVRMQSSTPPSLISSSKAFDSEASGFKIYVPSASLSIYQSATGWNEYKSILESY